ncbi:hypothetical protein CNMCM6936_002528 [Aspergillus lentulus]|nr:hypothetical protein CNMCM6069_004123 [Aspergillus lentulus]KAF4168433.1 hypothetical protein CNMCM6936_002528 [Aspergillus lentulus]
MQKLYIENARVDGARKSARQEAKQAGPLGDELTTQRPRLSSKLRRIASDAWLDSQPVVWASRTWTASAFTAEAVASDGGTLADACGTGKTTTTIPMLWYASLARLSAVVRLLPLVAVISGTVPVRTPQILPSVVATPSMASALIDTWLADLRAQRDVKRIKARMTPGPSKLESHSYRRSHSTANSTKPPVILSSEPPDAIAKLIIDPTCRRRPRAPTHVLQRRRTQTIINRPKLPLEIATSYFAEFIGPTVEDELYAKEPNASYVARQALRVRRRWLNYVIETGFRCEVFIAGVSRTPRMVVIEELGAEGWFSDQGAGV